MPRQDAAQIFAQIKKTLEIKTLLEENENDIYNLIKLSADVKNHANLLSTQLEVFSAISQGKEVAMKYLPQIQENFNATNSYLLVNRAVRMDDIETLAWLVNDLDCSISPENYSWQEDCRKQRPIYEYEREDSWGFGEQVEKSYKPVSYSDEYFNYKHALLLAADLQCMNTFKWLFEFMDDTDIDFYYERLAYMSASRPVLFSLLLECAVQDDHSLLFSYLHQATDHHPELKIDDEKVKCKLHPRENIQEWIAAQQEEKLKYEQETNKKLATTRKRKERSSSAGMYAPTNKIIVCDDHGIEYEAVVTKRIGT